MFFRKNNQQFFIFFILFSLCTACKSNSQPPFLTPTAIKTVQGSKAMVVSAHPLASEVGSKILQQGGNAVDAAIAIQLALAVVYPRAGNLGGGGFMVYRGVNGETNTLDFREKAPSEAYKEMYLDNEGNVMTKKPQRGHLAAGVPGTVDGIFEMYQKYSRLRNFEALIQPAIDLAEYGYAITEKEAAKLNEHRQDFIQYNLSPTPFTKRKRKNDTLWKKGDILIQKDLAQTLQRIKQQGRAGFYDGKTADLIVREMTKGGGIIRREDLQNYHATWRTPLIGQYKGYDIITMPPPSSGGILMLQMLSMMEKYPIKEYGFHSPEAVHLVVEAENRAFADRAEHLGDPDFYKVPQKTLLSKEYIEKRFLDFDPTKATPANSIRAGKITSKESEQTTHLSIVDTDGNAVSLTTTLNDNYGSHTVVTGAGFLLNDEMDDFSAKAGVANMYGAIGSRANEIAPNKRMLSSMTPTIVCKNGQLFMVLGTPGGTTIITSVMQVIQNVVDFEMPLTEAVHSPRFHSQWLPDKISIEKDVFSDGTTQKLQQMGHTNIELRTSPLGAIEAIQRLASGQFIGVADNRGDDHAVGF